jgi:hypothetical protein
MNPAQEIKATGHYTVLALTRDLLPNEIDFARRVLRGDRVAGERLPIRDIYDVKNICPTAGRNALARRLANDTTYTGIINYGALGSGSSSFANTSTQLNTEVFRKLTAGTYVDGNIAYIDWFIASGDVADQTFNEFGAFIDGIGTANTGQLFSAVLTGGWVKSGALFISLAATFS